MAQWETLKKSVPHAILLFRLGDFYEAFHDDAHVIARELELTLTKRQEVPMAGVPFHASENYIDRLVAKGFHVAVAEQVEDARLAKGLVKRKIVRVVTPGTLITSSLLPENANNFLICLTQLNRLFGIAALDLTTAEFRVFETDDKKALFDELLCLRPAEVLISQKFQAEHESLLLELKAQAACGITAREEWHFDHAYSLDVLLRHFKVHNLDGFGLKGLVPATNAAGALFALCAGRVKSDCFAHPKAASAGACGLHGARICNFKSPRAYLFAYARQKEFFTAHAARSDCNSHGRTPDEALVNASAPIRRNDQKETEQHHDFFARISCSLRTIQRAPRRARSRASDHAYRNGLCYPARSSRTLSLPGAGLTDPHTTCQV